MKARSLVRRASVRRRPHRVAGRLRGPPQAARKGRTTSNWKPTFGWYGARKFLPLRFPKTRLRLGVVVVRIDGTFRRYRSSRCLVLYLIMAPGGGQGGASRQVFGQTMRKKSSSSSANRNSQYQRQFGGGGRRKGTGIGPNYSSSAPDDFDAAAKRRQRQIVGEEIDARFGMERFTARNQHSHNSSHHSTRSHVTHNSNVEQSRRGWLFNILPTSVSVDR